MDKAYKDLSLHANLTPSLLEAIETSSYDKSFSAEQKKIIDDFFGPDGTNANEVVSQYFQELVSQIKQLKANNNNNNNSTTLEKPSGEEKKSKQFTDNMVEILTYLIIRQHNPAMLDYSSRIQSICDKIEHQIADLFLYDTIKGIPQEEIDGIQKIIYVWTKIPNSVNKLPAFMEIERQMSMNGTPISKESEYSYFYTFVKSYLPYAKKNMELSFYDGDKDRDIRNFDSHIQYWAQWVQLQLEHVSQDKDECINSVWRDDIVNVMLQIMDRKIITDEYLPPHLRISEARNKFLQNQGITDEKVQEAYETLEQISKEYQTKELDNKEKLKQFADAYKIVYLHEFISGEQTSSKVDSTKYAEFILVNSGLILGISDKAIDSSTLVRRATQELTAKELSKRFSKINCEKDDFRSISYDEPNFMYTNVFGLAYAAANYQLIYYSTPSITGNCGLDLIGTIAHESDHIINGFSLSNGICDDIHLYMEYKTKLAELYIIPENYSDLYYEIRAEIRAKIAKIQALNDFPIEYPSGSLDQSEDSSKREQNVLKNEINTDFALSMASMIRHIDGGEKKVDSIVKIFDNIAKDGKAIKQSRYKAGDALAIEYNEDGTPKTYAQILSDQLQEMENDTPNEMSRLKFRLQIMMYRAVAHNQEIECVNEINNFLRENRFMLEDYEFIREFFKESENPAQGREFFGKDEVIEKYESYMQDNNFEGAEFFYEIYNIQERVIGKKKELADKITNTAANYFGIPFELNSSIPSESTAEAINDSNQPDDQLPI